MDNFFHFIIITKRKGKYEKEKFPFSILLLEFSLDFLILVQFLTSFVLQEERIQRRIK